MNEDPDRIHRLRTRAIDAQDRADRARLSVAVATQAVPIRNEVKEASDILRALNNAQPRPKLGDANRKPTPQGVDQWIKSVENIFNMACITAESVTRTRWVIGTVEYPTHRQLLTERLDAGPLKGWQWVKNKAQSLVQDPILTKFENYVKFFNFHFREHDEVNEFLSQLSKKESLLPRSFFKTLTGDDDHELKIAFIWSKIPEVYRREMQRQGNFQSIVTWEEFERCLLNAEAASRPPLGTSSSRNAASDNAERPNAAKRNSFQQGREPKRRDRKYSNSSNRASPARGDHAPRGGRYQGGGGSSYRGNDNRREDRRDDHDDRRDNRQSDRGDRRDGNRDNGRVNNRPEHWKNRGNNNNGSKPDDAGKANP